MENPISVVVNSVEALWQRIPGGAKVGAMAAVLLAAYIAHVLERDRPSPPPEPDCTTTDCPPPDREETPFMWQGRRFDDMEGGNLNRLRRTYNPARRLYPDAASCMADGADYSDDYSAARLAWDRFPTKAEAEVCLFRLFTKLRTLDRVEAWLTQTGYFGKEEHDGLIYPKWGKPIPVKTLSMTWDMHNPAARYGGKEPSCSLLSWTTQAYRVNVTMQEPDRLMGLSIYGIGCWTK